MVIHEAVQASITPVTRDILIGPINPSGIASISAPNLLLNSHAHESHRLDSPLNPNGIVFEGSQTRYEELRGAVSEVLRDIGIRDVKDREEMLRSFDRLHEGEEKAVADFQAVLGDFQDGIVDPILEGLKDVAAFIDKEAPIILSLTGLSIGASMAGYLAVDYLRRRHDHIIKRYPQARKALSHVRGNSVSLQRLAVLTASFSGLLAGCTTGMVVVTASQTAPAPDGSSPSPAPVSPDRTLTPASNATVTAPDATHTPEPAPNIPPPEGYQPDRILGSQQIGEPYTENGEFTDSAENSITLGHKFSAQDIRDIINSKAPKYGLDAVTAESVLSDMDFALNHSSAGGPDREVSFVLNTTKDEQGNPQSKGFIILTSNNGNKMWIAKDSALGRLNLQPSVTYGLQEFSFGNWVGGEIPDKKNTVITEIDLTPFGGIGNVDFVFQNGELFAYMVVQNQTKGGLVISNVFDARETDRTTQWKFLESSTPVPDPTVEPTPTETPTPTPEPTLQHFSNSRYINVASISNQVFQLDAYPNWLQQGDYVYSHSIDVGSETIVERLSSYPGFEGAVVHTVVNGPPKGEGNQHAFILVERLKNAQIIGAWAIEKSFEVITAPPKLIHSGLGSKDYPENPIAMLSSLGMHLPDYEFRVVGGTRLISNGDGNYYVALYRVNRDQSNISDPRKVQIKIGEKYGLREELIYDEQNANKPTIRSFLITFDGNGNKTYTFIGQLPLSDDIIEIKGDMSWLGAYTGYYTKGLEVVEGELEILR